MTRHTLSDAYESSQALLLAQATRPHAEPTSDVEVTRNAKGDWQFKVAVTMRDADAAFAKAVELAAKAELRFPFVHEPSLTEKLAVSAADEIASKRARGQMQHAHIAAKKSRRKDTP